MATTQVHRMQAVYFISHPDVTIDPSVPITDWSLSATGVRRMQSMLSLCWVAEICRVVCSSEKKAVDGAKILAGHLNLPYAEHHELGENDRSSTGYLPPAEFENVADRFFAKPDQSVRGWETADDAQRRIVAAVQNIARNNSVHGPLAIVSHGAVGALLLCHLNGWRISRKHDQPGNGGGHFFCFDAETGAVAHEWKPIDGGSV